jgi:hypothetical protein
MADNVTLPGTGEIVAADNIGAAKFQRVKVTLGADGANDGDVSATNPMPTRASNGTSFLTAKALNVAPADADIAQVVQSILHGRSSAGGGTYVDVKVAPSGALVADVSDSQLPLPTGAATDAVVQAIRDRLPSAFLTPGLLSVDTLARPDVARQLAAGAASANTALTTTCRRVSIHARTADIRYAIGTGAQTASATSHFIAAGERLDLDVPASAQIAVIRAGSTDGVLELSELT